MKRGESGVDQESRAIKDRERNLSAITEELEEIAAADAVVDEDVLSLLQTRIKVSVDLGSMEDDGWPGGKQETRYSCTSEESEPRKRETECGFL